MSLAGSTGARVARSRPGLRLLAAGFSIVAAGWLAGCAELGPQTPGATQTQGATPTPDPETSSGDGTVSSPVPEAPHGSPDPGPSEPGAPPAGPEPSPTESEPGSEPEPPVADGGTSVAPEPVGTFERAVGVAGGVEIKGWAHDPDTPDPIYVWVTLDGDGRHLLADQPRPDVAAAHASAGSQHGFAATIAAPHGRRTVCVTASNVGPGVHTDLGCRTVEVPGAPFGNVESVRAVDGGVEITGWAIDPDTSDPVYLWATVDEVGRHLLADQPRPDVAAAHPGHGTNHGFLATLPASTGLHRVCVTVSNVGLGEHESLGCRVVAVGAVSTVRDVQRILQGLSIPTGPVDGFWGAQTAQGLCTFRQLAGLPVSRQGINEDDLDRLLTYDAAYAQLWQIPAPERMGRSTYLLASLTCQTMLYVQDGHYSRVFRISSGNAEYPTPAGRYVLGSTWPGWSCSTLFPDACYNRPYGMNALIEWDEESEDPNPAFSQFGNMYNKRSFLGSYMLHGSAFVPTYPASHGCVRMTIADSDWMYRNLTTRGGVIAFEVVGGY